MIIQIGGNVIVQNNWIQLIGDKTSKKFHMTFIDDGTQATYWD